MKRTVLAAMLLATTAGGVAVWQGPALAQSVMGTKSGVDQALIDRTANPGDDFNAYANGVWLKTAEIPADRSSIGVGLDVSNVAEARNADIIQNAGNAHAKAGTDLQRIADYYAAYDDTAGIEARGLAPLRPTLASIAALRTKSQLSAMLGANMRADTDPFNNNNYASTSNLFGLFVSQDLNRPTVNVPYLMQGGLGLPDRDYYLSDKKEMAELRDGYKDYVAKLFKLAGMSDPQGRADRVLALEMKIAAAQTDIITAQDAHKGDNPWKRADFAAKAPGIDWNAFWTAAGLPRQQDFINWNPGTTTKLAALVASEPMATWQDWLAFHQISQNTSVLPKAFDDASFDFYGKQLSGTPAQRPRDKRSISAVNGALGDPVGRIYAAKYFPASSKAAINTMVKNIVAAFDRRIAGLDWMAPATKVEARKKLAVLKVGVGYPDKWRAFPYFAVSASDPLGNLQRARLSNYRYHVAKLGHAPDRGEWWMTPQTVNAVNLPLQNALNFPAAILQTPYFDPSFDAAANYGAIGAVIGHEISHSFDNLGSDFDSTGRLHNWWTPADLTRFEASGKALADQYSAYEALPGLHLNGEQELGENIADTAGLTASYEAYHASLGGKPAPVIDGLTGDQRFFLAFAQSWRTKMRDRSLRARIATDVHAPAPWRVETVRNLDAWYDAFGIKPGDKRYLAPKDRVHVW
ncbi:M13 family metallopeptidase [Sphingomonas sp.]|jgi:putative endopeptidase|uniref:M13 family metallopeptidase n=1 Tax=Sphingomonas sp. TaxID=28214 RepID=UPI002E31760D|nr:M13 family metallopeptidase [Sphingomonas sp.]HEX4695972.1 M13 family metallopeptidase [Sphingomonas sp.]